MNAEKKLIDFMGKRHYAAALSLLLVFVSAASLTLGGLNLGLDFSGGTLVEVGYVENADLKDVRERLVAAGYERARVVSYGSERELLIRLSGRQEQEEGERLLQVLRESSAGVEVRRVEYVGPQVGAELREKGGLALLAALAVVMIYVAFRFQLKFSVGAVIALFHDVLIILGFFSLLRWDFDLTVLAALLAVIGYSLNDTIVVSDRIRENFRKLRRGSAIEIVNTSLNQTIGRTLLTSMTTLMVLLVLLLAGGELIRGFALALSIGVVVGTYSSIYVAANALLLLRISREDMALPKKEQGSTV